MTLVVDGWRRPIERTLERDIDLGRDGPGLQELRWVARCRQRGEHAQWQRCRVHFMRNILGRVGKAHGETVTATIRTIFARRHFTRSVVIDAAVRYLFE